MRIDYTGQKEDDKRRFACISWDEKENVLAEKILAGIEADTLYHADCFGTGDHYCAYIKVEDKRDYQELLELYKEAKEESLVKIFAEIEDTAKLFTQQNVKDCSKEDFEKVQARCSLFVDFASARMGLLNKMHANEVRIWIDDFKKMRSAVSGLLCEGSEKEGPFDEEIKKFSIKELENGMYLTEENNGKCTFGKEEDRIIFYDEVDAESTLEFLNLDTDYCCVLLDESKFFKEKNLTIENRIAKAKESLGTHLDTASQPEVMKTDVFVRE